MCHCPHTHKKKKEKKEKKGGNFICDIVKSYIYDKS